MFGKCRVGLQVSIVLIIAFVVACLTIATATTIFFASTHAAKEGAQHLFDEITQRLANRVEDEISQLQKLAGLGASLSQVAVPVQGDGMNHPMTPFLMRSLAQDPNLYSVYVGQPNGAFLQVIAVHGNAALLASNHAPDDTRYIVRDITVDPMGAPHETRTFLSADDAVLGQSVNDNPEYDPRQREWYKSALAQKGTVMSEPYVFSSLQQPGLTASRQAEVPGYVFAVDISLSGLSDFVASQDISPHGGLVLLDKDHRVMAISPTLTKSLRVTLLPMASLSSIDSTLLRVVDTTHAGSGAVLAGTYSGEVIAQMSTWMDSNGKPMGIGVVSPFSDFTGPIHDMQVRIIRTAILVLLVVVPLALLFARRISHSVRALALQAAHIREFDFSADVVPYSSFITEFSDLGEAFDLMRSTIATRSQALADAQHRLERLVDLGIAMSSERDTGVLMEMILSGAKELSNADGGTLYIRDDDKLKFQIVRNDTLKVSMGGVGQPAPSLPSVPLFKEGKPNHNNVASHAVLEEATVNITDAYDESRFDFTGTKMFDQLNHYHSQSFLTVPLKPRGGDVIGVVQLINARPLGSNEIIPFSSEIQRFVEALSAQAATALYNRDLLDAQERLMDALIQIIAGAIDAKSPYTGGHCERVPELSLMLAKEACKVEEGPLADFEFTTPEQWREFRIGAWLHDCGKVTTPEYVVDKATKLETIYNRIHEVRTRFEVLLRDARITMLEAVAQGTPSDQAEAAFEAEKAQLLDDFAFVAECNLGGEFMAPERVERLKTIAQRVWLRHFDDRLGLAHEELKRYTPIPVTPVPAPETLLADKPYHVIPRPAKSAQFDPALGFKTTIPENLYNFGEVYNLSVGRGTLTEEERFKINEHIIQTIIMLKRLPFPKHLSRVVEYAGTHHETLTGSGYPRRLTAEDLSIPARITAIADIFEALTASDRPYKKPKTLSECVKILSFFKKDKHIDADLFDLFLTSGVYRTYAERFLLPDQIDTVDVAQYVG